MWHILGEIKQVSLDLNVWFEIVCFIIISSFPALMLQSSETKLSWETIQSEIKYVAIRDLIKVQ